MVHRDFSVGAHGFEPMAIGARTLVKSKNLHKKSRCTTGIFLWEHTDSNRGPSACKADALNQLSYAPLIGRAKIKDFLMNNT